MMKRTVMSTAICSALTLNTASASITYSYDKIVENETVYDNQVGINPNQNPNTPIDNSTQDIREGGKSVNGWVFERGTVTVSNGGILDKAKVGAPRTADELNKTCRQNLYFPSFYDGQVDITDDGLVTDSQIIDKGNINVHEGGNISNTSVNQMGVLRFNVGGKSTGALNVGQQAFVTI